MPEDLAPGFLERLAGEDVRITLVKDGGHRLSRDADLVLLTATLAGLVG